MTIPEIEAKLVEIAQTVDNHLNPEKHTTGRRPLGFAIIAFSFGDDKSFAFLSNAATSESLVPALLELVRRLEAGSANSRTVTVAEG